MTGAFAAKRLRLPIFRRLLGERTTTMRHKVWIYRLAILASLLLAAGAGTKWHAGVGG